MWSKCSIPGMYQGGPVRNYNRSMVSTALVRLVFIPSSVQAPLAVSGEEDDARDLLEFVLHPIDHGSWGELKGPVNRGPWRLWFCLRALSDPSLRNETSQLDGGNDKNSHRTRLRGAPGLVSQLLKLPTCHQLCIFLLLHLNRAFNRARSVVPMEAGNLGALADKQACCCANSQGKCKA